MSYNRANIANMCEMKITTEKYRIVVVLYRTYVLNRHHSITKTKMTVKNAYARCINKTKKTKEQKTLK